MIAKTWEGLERGYPSTGSENLSHSKQRVAARKQNLWGRACKGEGFRSAAFIKTHIVLMASPQPATWLPSPLAQARAGFLKKDWLARLVSLMAYSAVVGATLLVLLVRYPHRRTQTYPGTDIVLCFDQLSA